MRKSLFITALVIGFGAGCNKDKADETAVPGDADATAQGESTPTDADPSAMAPEEAPADPAAEGAEGETPEGEAPAEGEATPE
jgi:hypothetical protein